MSYRKIMDAVDTKTGRKIYFVNDARYTFTDSGSHIEEPMTRLGLEIDKLNVKCDNMVTELSVSSISYATKERIREEFGEFANIPMGTFTAVLTAGDGTIIHTDTYQFEIGMTWRQWIESEYNTSGNLTNNKICIGHLGPTVECVEFNGYDMTYYAQLDNVIEDGIELSADPASCCFVAGTQVAMADGTTKNIEDIQIGDKVLSYNVDTKSSYETKVINCIVNKNSIDMARIVTETNKELVMTSYHPLLTVDGWKSLTNYNGYETLQIGDELIIITGKSDKIINIERWQETIPISTYTLNVIDKNENPDVDENDNFYVNGFIGHNASCPWQ